MSLSFGSFVCLLVYLPFTQEALTVTIPEGTIQAKPGSDVSLPCNFEESSGHIDPKRLAVIWRVGTRIIAKYEDKLEIFHKGAKMSPEDLLRGNASLLLPNVQGADSNTYVCVVIHSPDREQQSVELKVEAPPLVKLGSTKVQLTKPSTLVCMAAGFYPGNISMTWFRNNRIVQGPEQPPAQPSTGQLFRAESILELIPEFSDANANFSCHIHHQANEGPEVLNFQLQLQARPILQLITRPKGEKFVAAECKVSKFYPSQIHIQWLQNGVPQEYVKSEVHRMHNGMFSINSVLFPQTSDVQLTYVCRVEHEALETPLEQSVLWKPEGEGDAIIRPSLPSTQSTRNTFFLSPSRLTVTPITPSISVSRWMSGLAIGFGFGFGFGSALGAGIMYYKYKVKKNSVTGTSNEKKALQKIDEEKVQNSLHLLQNSLKLPDQVEELCSEPLVLSSSEEEKEKEKEQTLIKCQDLSFSPSPPPLQQKNHHVKAQIFDQSLRNLTTSLSAAKKSLQEQGSESDEDDVILVDVFEPQELMLKVRCRADLYRVCIQMTQPLQRVVEHMSQILNVHPNRILLLHRDCELATDATPAKLDLGVADIIDCIVETSSQRADDSGTLLLRVQGKDKSSVMEITIQKGEPLEVLMNQYRQAQGLDRCKLVFYFDGQRLAETLTPEQLGMESGDVIEVWK
ncbi:NFATC2-interacting protein isoform X2 [Crotalus tigris]|uniref:NFATC2-interacting protein isoform X2 n=1 Tax=Crotalus tigris TaxID=88082 RepID=UPI00192F5F8D|nr:NFATC2-interacting protein isoform X2 [Crotalus tigris]